MAHQQNIIDELISDGRLRTTPYETRTTVTVLDINMENLRNRIQLHMLRTFIVYEPLRRYYTGTSATIDGAITTDVNSMADFAVWCCYNRLRTVAERFSPSTRTSRINHKAPCSNRMEFPSFISSLLQSIGPLRITDAAKDVLVIYAPVSGTANNYGRTQVTNPSEGNHSRLLDNLKLCNIHCSPIDVTPNFGSFWTTCEVRREENLTHVLGTCHPSHYINEDAIRALLLSTTPATNPFETVALTVGYVDDKTTMTALAAVANPTGVPASITATSAGRPSGIIYDVNRLGIKPAIAATDTTPAVGAGCYILGRTNARIFTCYLARHITDYELYELVRLRLTSSQAPSP